MRAAATIITNALCGVLFAQVTVDGPVQLTGAPADRRIVGVAAPVDGSAAITVGTALLGTGHWATASVEADTVVLQLTPATSTLNDGLLIRFAAPTDLGGPIHLRVDGAPALALRRPDGLVPLSGQITSGAVCEVILNGGAYVLLAPASRGCAPGWSLVHERLCIETQDTPGLNFHQAATRCAEVGGRLCTWDEYHVACTLLESQLLGLFDGWEWIDDTSNHTHTGDQAGSTDCAAQRSAVPLNAFQTRCCMHPR